MARTTSQPAGTEPGPNTPGEAPVDYQDHPFCGDTSSDQKDGLEDEEDHLTEGEDLSERDEGLGSTSEGDSSCGDDSQFAGPPNLQRLVRFGQEHCRCPCRLKNKDGVKVASICGKKAKDCQLHAKRRLGADSYQYAVGSYPPVPVARGFTGHGLASGPYYTDARIRAFQAEEKER